MPGFQIEIKGGRVRLVHLFRARLWSSAKDPQDISTLTYSFHHFHAKGGNTLQEGTDYFACLLAVMHCNQIVHSFGMERIRSGQEFDTVSV